MKKKIISGLLVLALCLSSAAFAGQTFSFTDKSGQYGNVHKTKTTATGTKGSVSIEANSANHSMYYQIHKANGGAASVYKNTTAGSGSYSLSYNKDGHGNSLGRKGYKYRLRIAHRRQCTCTDCNASNPAIVTADFTP